MLCAQQTCGICTTHMFSQNGTVFVDNHKFPYKCNDQGGWHGAPLTVQQGRQCRCTGGHERGASLGVSGSWPAPERSP